LKNKDEAANVSIKLIAILSMPDRNATRKTLVCYRCGSSLESLSPPLARLDLCPECGVELHVCRMCTHYAPSQPDACDEEDAPEFTNKTSANFCDYFEPDPDVYDGNEQRADAEARAKLDALFGAGADGVPGESGKSTADEMRDQAESLFKK
jgi:hypothetical protein